jgi:hypothetical protein
MELSKIMSHVTKAQVTSLQALREDYGVAHWNLVEGIVVSAVVHAVDDAGDHWRIDPGGDPTCLGGGTVVDGPEPKEKAR